MDEGTAVAEQVKERKVKAKNPFVVGLWNEDGFVQAETQPAEPITELAKILAWTKKQFDKDGGKFEFIRRVPGVLSIEKKTVTTTTFNG